MGGGATDISTVTSSMSYSNGRTNRSEASLLARCIVAGGGAGASARYTAIRTTDTVWEDVINETSITNNIYGSTYYHSGRVDYTGYEGQYIKLTIEGGDAQYVKYYVYTLNGTLQAVDTVESSSNTWYFTLPSSDGYIRFDAQRTDGEYPSDNTITISIQNYEESEDLSSDYTTYGGEGGGKSGNGSYSGGQSSAGSGGGFGYGANQETTNYMYCGGAGGGGWYGGGTYRADGTTDAIGYGSGGSGFVNTAANASYRPSGYTGLELDSGSTTAGNSSHPSVSGGTEVGHSGNGYARITVL